MRVDYIGLLCFNLFELCEWIGFVIGFKLDSFLKFIDIWVWNNRMIFMYYLCKVVFVLCSVCRY